MSDEAYIYEAVRTPRGRGKKGSLYATKPVDLVAGLIDELRSRLPGLDPGYIDDLVLGVVTPIGRPSLTAWWYSPWTTRPNPPTRCPSGS